MGVARMARHLARGPRTLEHAGPWQLGGSIRWYTFTDGPSQDPRIVSVAARPRGWGVAVRSSTGACFYLHLDAQGRATFGSGDVCTGTVALAASARGW
jgi:hypothetical protein